MEPLTENNWFTWSRKVISYLKVKGVYRAVEEGAPEQGQLDAALTGAAGGIPATVQPTASDAASRELPPPAPAADATQQQQQPQQQLESAASRGTGSSGASRTEWREPLSHAE